MPANKKPKKAHKKKRIAIPVLGVQLDESQKQSIELAARIQLDKLFRGVLDVAGWNTLAAHFNLAWATNNGKGFDGAMASLESIRARQRRTGKYGATGDEREIIMREFESATDQICSCSDVQIKIGIKYVMDHA